MSSRDILKNGIRVASVLALLAAVLSSPIRPSTVAGRSPHPNFFRRSFALPPTYSNGPSGPSITSPSTRIKAVRSQNEEERLDSTTLVRCPSAPPNSPPPQSHPRKPASSGLVRAFH